MNPFPPVDNADEDGLLAFGGILNVTTLTAAYGNGIFPWPMEGLPLLWFAPPQRALLKQQDFHVSRRLQRTVRKAQWEVRVNTRFEEVILACASQRREEGTWITPQMIEGYCRLHAAGHAYSVETYYQGELAGGLYGVVFGGYCSGESMFFRVTDASKVAVVRLMQWLGEQGCEWLDIQMMTPLFRSFGATEVPRPLFMEMLRPALARRTLCFKLGSPDRLAGAGPPGSFAARLAETPLPLQP